MRLGLSEGEIFDILRAHFEAKGFIIPKDTDDFKPFRVNKDMPNLAIDIENVEIRTAIQMPKTASAPVKVKKEEEEEEEATTSKFINPDHINAALIRKLKEEEKERKNKKTTMEEDDDGTLKDILD